FGPPTKSEIAAMRAHAAAGDGRRQSAYQAGVEGRSFEDLDEETRDTAGAIEAWESGVTERDEAPAGGPAAEPADQDTDDENPPAGGGRARPQLKGPGGAVNDGAGFVLGALLWALVLAYLRGGPPMVKGWLRAKFLNKPYQAGTGDAGAVGAAVGGLGAQAAKVKAKVKETGS
ncbi:MAG TPA: hypothetical protein VGX21_13325, partial [Methylomirabilota bacterium]|nr:hypothetical protein [Methylomirabilota bacterium]